MAAQLIQNDCWLYAGTINKDGYGVIWDKVYGNYRLAHRVLYETKVGKVRYGLHLDHLCRQPQCINPDHLEPVTARTNILRGVGIAAKYAQRNKCSKGHLFTPENIYYWKDKKCRFCRECRKIEDRKHKLKNKRSKK